MRWLIFLVVSVALFPVAMYAEEKHGWIGVAVVLFQPMEHLAKAIEWDERENTGVMVHEVVPGGPADKAGIQRSDVITHIQGVPVTSSRDLSSRVARLSPGSTAMVTVMSLEGSLQAPIAVTQELVITIQERPDDIPRNIPTDPFTAGWRTTPAWAADGETLCRTYNRLVTKCIDRVCAELTVSTRRELAVMMAKEIEPGLTIFAEADRNWLVDEIMGKCPQLQ